MEYKQIPSQIGTEERTISANDWSILERKTAEIDDLITDGAHSLSNALLGVLESYFSIVHQIADEHPDNDLRCYIGSLNMANAVFYVHQASQILEETEDLLRFIQHLKDEKR